MSTPNKKQVSRVRAISRALVRELGFMNRNIAGTDLSPSAVHTIVEIGLAESLSANDLRELLILEKSSVSRLIQSLVSKGLVTETNSELDGRKKLIRLTKKGTQTLNYIDSYAETRICSALGNLNANDRNLILDGLKLYSSCLTQGRLDATSVVSTKNAGA